MFWRTDSGSRLTSNPATSACPDVGLSSPQSMRIVVDLPAPFGPRKPKTSPLRTARLIRSTATKFPNRLTRLSTTTELLFSVMSSGPRTNGINKQILDGWLHLLNRIEGNVGASEPGIILGNAARSIV